MPEICRIEGVKDLRLAGRDENQVEYFETLAIRRYPTHPVIRLFARQRLATLQKYIDRNKVRTILDVGCGHGCSSYYLREWGHVVGLDRSHRLLTLNPTGHKVQGDASGLPFPDTVFDLVVIWEVLHHMSDPILAIREAARVSRRYVAVFEPNRSNPLQAAFALLQREHRLVFRYSLRYLRSLVSRAGLDVVESFRGGWIFPNRTPQFMIPLLGKLPYRWPLGISVVVVGKRG